MPFEIRLEKEPLATHHPHGLASITAQTEAPEDVIKTHLKPQHQDRLFENWYAEHTVRRDHYGKLSYTYNDVILFGYAPLNRDGLDGELGAVYRDLVQLLRAKSYALLRVWNYLPQLLRAADYRLFCAARAQAFGGAAADFYCAATVIGSDSDHGAIYFIAARTAGVAIDNPRQTTPHLYPKRYVDPPPIFARATLKRWSAKCSHLYISGTASIVGSSSVYANDAGAQLGELRRNLEALLAATAEVEHGYSTIKLAQLRCCKLYVSERVAHDIDALVEQHLDFKALQIFVGQLCRPELLVEAEAMAIVD